MDGLGKYLLTGEQPDYDYAGYIKKYGVPDQSKGQHLTDEFKLPNHITFSDDSRYSNALTPGGTWREGEIAPPRVRPQWEYTPSDYVIQQQGWGKLADYFSKYEPDSKLNPPQGRTAEDLVRQSISKTLLGR